MTLYLVLKGEWFDKIESGEKTHEYRLLKTYWYSRMKRLFPGMGTGHTVVFVRGYQKNARKMQADLVRINVTNGIGTDLKVDADVYDIEFRNVRRIS